MRRPRTQVLSAALALLLASLLALASPAWADGPAGAPPAPAPVAPASGEAKPEPTPALPTMTDEELTKRVAASKPALAAMLTLKYGAAIAGLVVLVLAWSRSRDAKRGLGLPLRPSAPPPEPVALPPALALGLLWAAGGTVLSSVLANVPGARWSAATDPIGVSLAGTALSTVPVALYISARIRRQRRLEASSPWPAGPALRASIDVFCVSCAVVVGLSLLVKFALQALLDAKPMVQDLIVQIFYPRHPKDPWLIAVFGVFIAPATEECVFRGMLYPAVRGLAGRGWAAVLVSAAFAALHRDLTAALPLFGLAMLLSFLYERTGSLLAVIGVHVLNNGTSLLPMFLAR